MLFWVEKIEGSHSNDYGDKDIQYEKARQCENSDTLLKKMFIQTAPLFSTAPRR